MSSVSPSAASRSAPAPRVRADLILGTAGHIDHGKTALVKALSGVDTDRLAEEKKRGITIELGFAPYAPAPGCAFGIVDVPGHEAFVRTMVAGAAGMDVALLVVAGDEGVMPQTREHVAVVSLLGVRRMVVALTKADLVDAEWLELVEEDARALLAGTPYAEAEVAPVSAVTGEGLDALSAALVRCAAQASRDPSDLARLPVDRVFALEGAGTVVTGTLWSGRLERGGVVRILPGDEDARIRSVEVHGEARDAAQAGQRVAVALTGAAVRRGRLRRGDVLVTSPAWAPSMMLTVELVALEGTGWSVEHGQRVRVHLGTAEVLGRLALFLDESARGDQPVPGAESAPGAGRGVALRVGQGVAPPGRPVLAQLRLEAPVVARSGDRFVIRSYSPLATIAGGVVLEPNPPKRKKLSAREREALAMLARGGRDAVRGAAVLAGWQGLPESELGVVAGGAAKAGAVSGDSPLGPDEPVWRHDGALFDGEVVADGEARILAAAARRHAARPLDAGAPLDVIRTALPARAHPRLADGLAARLARQGRLVLEGKTARLPEFRAVLSPSQERIAERISEALAEAGLEGPSTTALLERTGAGDEGAAVLDFLERRGRARLVGDAFWVSAAVLDKAAAAVAERLAGREGLGPRDFREALPVPRKHLIPLLAYLDAQGVTVREAAGRRVPGRA